MAQIKSDLFEELVRLCVREIYDQTNETVGAAAPPADGLGTGDAPALSKDSVAELKIVIKKMIRESLVKQDKQKKIEELVKHIVKETLDELMDTSTMTSNLTGMGSGLNNNSQLGGLGQKPLSSIEQAKLRKQEEDARRAEIKANQNKLKVLQKTKPALDQQKREVERNIKAAQEIDRNLKGGSSIHTASNIPA